MPDFGFISRRSGASSLPIYVIPKESIPDWLNEQPDRTAAWVRAHAPDSDGRLLTLPDNAGGVAGALLIARDRSPEAFGPLPLGLPEGSYHLATELSQSEANHACLGWALGSYQFDRYKAASPRKARLAFPAAADRKEIDRLCRAHYLVRDLINTPAEDLGPKELADAAKSIAKKHDAKARVIKGVALLEQGYPMVHVVGRAAHKAPHLIDMHWGPKNAPRITLVGKGVCFDSGGLDIKGADNMLLMKKDMGGAAHALGLADLIMSAGLPVRLRVLIPAVENAIAGNAYRPKDILRSRKGLTVEVGNTDAEGRLVLADALAAAAEDKPDLLIDFATLTGAARVALGTELPALFTDDDALAAGIVQAGTDAFDPVWRLPLHGRYRRLIDSRVADLHSTGTGSYGGAITAALFLKEFTEGAKSWAHFDLMGWNLDDCPGRPCGGEAMGLRAVYGMLRARFSR